MAGNIHALIWNHVRGRRTGTVFVAPFDVLLSDVDVFQPDVLYLSETRRNLATERGVLGAPDLAIEVLSDSTRKRDEIVKRKRYEAFGVTEYWVLDPVLEAVKIYRRAGGGFESVAEPGTEGGGTITSPVLPGFSIDIADIFSE